MKKALVFSPLYNEEEREDARRLLISAAASGIDARCSYLESDLAKTIHHGGVAGEDAALLSRLSLAYDIFNISVSDCVIGFLNGKDEGVLVKLGIAYAMGATVFLYKYDVRVTFASGENSMVLGLSKHKPFRNVKKLFSAINAVKACKPDFGNLSCVIRDMISMGRDIAKELDEGAEFTTLVARFAAHPALTRFYNTPPSAPAPGGKVYCSGPLFCPAEHRTMKAIADSFEKRGISAYLPQRDGAEPFFMDSMGSPLAGSLFTKLLIGTINKTVFSADVKELMDCAYFVCNLNGRIYDEGAMAEAGMAFAAGKPVVLFHNDARSIFGGGLHTTLTAISATEGSSPTPEALADTVLAAAARYDQDGINIESVGCAMQKAYHRGKKYLRFFSHFKVPRDKMLLWQEGTDESK